MDQSCKEWQGRFVNEELQLREYLGGSQHSAVFLTERPAKNPQKAAIKLIPANSAHAEVQLSRWLSAASLSHPNVLRIFETGRCRLDHVELLYLVTEHAEENLSHIILERSLTPQETREMLDSILDALLYLHGKGFIHGSIRPSNIMAVADQLKISSDGVRTIGSLDEFGELRDGRSSSNASHYASPEASSTATTSPASDVWSLGMTLVEVLTQRSPTWDPADAQMPEDAAQNLPQPFLDIVRHALLRDPERRWSIGEIAARLQPNPEVHPAPASVPLSAEPLPRPKPKEHAIPTRTKLREQQKSRFSSPRYIVPSVAAGLILGGIIFMPRLLNQQPHAAQPALHSEPGPAQLRVPPAASRVAKQNAAPLPSTFASAESTKSAVKAPAPSPAILRPEAKTAGRSAVLHQVLPDVSAKARDTIHGTVRIVVRAHVNPAGSVMEADLENPAPSKYFADLSLQAARQWTFRAPESGGRRLPSEWLLRFYFTPSATRAVPEQITR